MFMVFFNLVAMGRIRIWIRLFIRIWQIYVKPYGSASSSLILRFTGKFLNLFSCRVQVLESKLVTNFAGHGTREFRKYLRETDKFYEHKVKSNTQFKLKQESRFTLVGPCVQNPLV